MFPFPLIPHITKKKMNFNSPLKEEMEMILKCDSKIKVDDTSVILIVLDSIM